MITTTAMEAKLLAIVEPSLRAMGYDVVQMRLAESARRPLLSCVAERQNLKTMTIEDCEAISHTMSALLDVEDPIASAYQLEVSSPGLERPLTRLQDFERFKGHEAKIEMVMPIEGRRRFKATIGEVADNHVVIDMEGKRFSLPYAQMKSAKLVATEALFRELFKAEGQAHKQEKEAKKVQCKKKKDHKKRASAF